MGAKDHGEMVRVAEPRDDEAIALLVLTSFYARHGIAAPHAPPPTASSAWKERLLQPGQFCLVAESFDGIAGVLRYEPFVDRRDGQVRVTLAHMSVLAVRPDRWGRGVAQQLVRDSLDQLSVNLICAIDLWTRENNDRARAFYEKYGWRLTGDREYSAKAKGLIVQYKADLRDLDLALR